MSSPRIGPGQLARAGGYAALDPAAVVVLAPVGAAAQELIDQAMANIDAGQRAEQVSEAEAVLARYDGWLKGDRKLRWTIVAPYSSGASGFGSNDS